MFCFVLITIHVHFVLIHVLCPLQWLQWLSLVSFYLPIVMIILTFFQFLLDCLVRTASVIQICYQVLLMLYHPGTTHSHWGASENMNRGKHLDWLSIIAMASMLFRLPVLLFFSLLALLAVSLSHCLFVVSLVFIEWYTKSIGLKVYPLYTLPSGLLHKQNGRERERRRTWSLLVITFIVLKCETFCRVIFHLIAWFQSYWKFVVWKLLSR